MERDTDTGPSGMVTDLYIWSRRPPWTVAALLHKGGSRAKTEHSLHSVHTLLLFCLCLWVFVSMRLSKRGTVGSWKEKSVRQLGVWWWKEALLLLRGKRRARAQVFGDATLTKWTPSTIMQPLRTWGRNRRRTKQTDGKSGSKTQLKKVTFWGVITVCFGLLALLSLGTTELCRRNLWLKYTVRKGLDVQNVHEFVHYLCLFTSSLPHCFSLASVKGYIDEQIARLQSVTVNERSAHDIISPLTCTLIHLCLPWKT